MSQTKKQLGAATITVTSREPARQSLSDWWAQHITRNMWEIFYNDLPLKQKLEILYREQKDNEDDF